MQAVIYAFRSPGSGAVYIGKHQCCPDDWPRRGTGPLPDGYRGSGVVVANFHRRHGAAVQWRILATVTEDREAVNAAERRAIRLARVLFGLGCVNRADGGDGFTSDDSRRVWNLPGVRAQQVPRLRAQQEGAVEAARSPEARAKALATRANWLSTVDGQAHLRSNGERLRRVMDDPKQKAITLAACHSPEARAKKAEALRAFYQTPEGKASIARRVAKRRKGRTQDVVETLTEQR